MRPVARLQDCAGVWVCVCGCPAAPLAGMRRRPRRRVTAWFWPGAVSITMTRVRPYLRLVRVTAPSLALDKIRHRGQQSGYTHLHTSPSPGRHLCFCCVVPRCWHSTQVHEPAKDLQDTGEAEDERICHGGKEHTWGRWGRPAAPPAATPGWSAGRAGRPSGAQSARRSPATRYGLQII